MVLTWSEKILLFLTILFLPTQLGKHFWPQFSYIYSLRVDYLSPTLYFWDILVMGLLSVWVLRKPEINKFALNLFLFFLFTQALSLIGASNIEAGLIRLEQFLGFSLPHRILRIYERKFIYRLHWQFSGRQFWLFRSLLKVGL